MPADDEVERIRNLTTAEVVRNFKELKARYIEEAKVRKNASLWHALNDPMTEEQYAELPPWKPGVESRVGLFWVKFCHADYGGEEVVSRGWFDHQDRSWGVRYRPVDDGDLKLEVTARAWACITPEQGPPEWNGVVIPKWRDEGF